MKNLVVRFSDRVSEMETTHQRLVDIADYLGVSLNKAVQYAINKAYERLAEEDDIEADLYFKRHGRKVGSVTYVNADEDFIRRVEGRIKKGVPLAHEDDESLERNLLFKLLPEDQQAQVRAANDPDDKRRLIASFLASADA